MCDSVCSSDARYAFFLSLACCADTLFLSNLFKRFLSFSSVMVLNLASSALTLNAVFPVGTCDVPKLENGSMALVGVVFPPFALALAVARFALLVIPAFAFAAVVVVVDAVLFTPLFAIDPPPPMIGRNAVVDVNALPPRRSPRGIYRPNAPLAAPDD